MDPRRRVFVVRRVVLTLIATAICVTLWRNGDQHSEVRSSLAGRRLLQKQNPENTVEEATSKPPKKDHGLKSTTTSSLPEKEEDVVTAIDKEEIPEEKNEETEQSSSPKQISRPPPVTKTTTAKIAVGEETTINPKSTTSPPSPYINGGQGEEEVGNHQPPPATTSRPRKHPASPNLLHKQPGGPKHQLTTRPPNASRPAVQNIEDCTPPAYREFPRDLFTHRQRAHGAVVVHIAVIVYMFYAVAVVCDDYFVAALSECCAKLNLSEDVAGATFMAAGSSAPELFTAILGVLVTKGDVGTGTIVGSAVFNVLFVIGVCGICSTRAVQLTWWPLFRDSVFYSCTVIILILIIADSEVTWYESVIMMVIYSLYIVLMKFNNIVHCWFSRLFGMDEKSGMNVGILSQGEQKNYSSYAQFDNEIEDTSAHAQARYTLQNVPADVSIRDSTRLTSIYDAALVFMMGRGFRSTTRFRCAAKRLIIEQRRLLKEARKLQGHISIDSQDESRRGPKNIITSMGLTSESNWKSIPTREEGCGRMVKWVIQAPLLAVLHCTIPDCRKERWRRFFLLTFFTSILWTAIFSYVMVWMVTLTGYTLGIPDSIMGITFLAAGTSVPDAFASLIVARQGQGDMAVSNSLGSNIFDILIGLAFPWFLQTAIIDPGSIATINSGGMVYSVVLLFLTILITIGGIAASKWHLTRRLGIVLLTVYALFLVLSILLEFNLLGDVNPPMCPD